MYRDGNDKFSYNIKAGFSFGAAFVTNSSAVLDGVFYKETGLETSPVEAGYTLGGGINIKRFGLGYFFESSTGIDPNGNGRLKRNVLLLNYRLGK
jgi:hypothetical protein